VLQDRLQFDNNYLRLELEKLKGQMNKKEEKEGKDDQQMEKIKRELEEHVKGVKQMSAKNGELTESLTYLQKERDAMRE
jgi:chromosome segregation ATPase